MKIFQSNVLAVIGYHISRMSGCAKFKEKKERKKLKEIEREEKTSF